MDYRFPRYPRPRSPWPPPPNLPFHGGRLPFPPPPPTQFGYPPPPPPQGAYGWQPPPPMAYPSQRYPRQSRPWKRPRNWTDGARGRGRGRDRGNFRPKRPHVDRGMWDSSDPYYDTSMFEDPWREILEARGLVDGSHKQESKEEKEHDENACKDSSTTPAPVKASTEPNDNPVAVGDASIQSLTSEDDQSLLGQGTSSITLSPDTQTTPTT